MLRETRKNSPHLMCPICDHAHKLGGPHIWSGKATETGEVAGSNPAAGRQESAPATTSVAQRLRVPPPNSEGNGSCESTSTAKARNRSPRKSAPKSPDHTELPVVQSHGEPPTSTVATSAETGTSETGEAKTEKLSALLTPAQQATLGASKPSRKEYLKLKARERRAREREAKAAHELLLGQLKEKPDVQS